MWQLKRNIYYCYAPIEPHQQPCHLFIFYIFFSLFKLFFPLFSKKKKKLLFSLLVHTPIVTLLPTFPFLFYLFISPLLYHYTSFLFFIYIFSLFKLFFSLLSKKKNKVFFSLVPICSHTYWCTSSNLFLHFLPLYLPTTLPLYFLPLFLYFNSSSTHFILYKFDIIFPFNPYFSHTKLWVLFLSLSLFFLSVNFCSFL